jgi:2-polyprenyl-3-methyl-5-hydroxy-6-metoxy-1,4-benzoquinol methylase
MVGRRSVVCAVCGSDKKQLLTVAHGNRGLPYIAEDHDVMVCESCGLVYLDPQHAESDYARYYASADYAPITASPKAVLRRQDYRRIQASYLIDTINKVKASPLSELSVLDIGCGPGVLLYHLREAGMNVTGLEASPEAAGYAEKSFGLNIIHGSIFDNVLTEKSFDVVTSTASMEHFTDPLAAVMTMKRALRPDGLLFINTPDLLGMVLKKGEHHCFKFVHTYYFTEKSLANLLERAGLRIVRNWTLKPQIESTIIYPGNYCSGELNCIAVNDGAPASVIEPGRRENVAEIRGAYAAAWRRDRFHYIANEAAKFRVINFVRRVLGRLFKPRAVFESFYKSDGSVDTRRFPPTDCVSTSQERHRNE